MLYVPGVCGGEETEGEMGGIGAVGGGASPAPDAALCSRPTAGVGERYRWSLLSHIKHPAQKDKSTDINFGEIISANRNGNNNDIPSVPLRHLKSDK